MDGQTLQRLNTLTDQLEALYKPLRTDQYNAPINRQEERERLMTAHARGTAYHPQFVYKDAPQGWEQPLLDYLRGLRPEANSWEALIYQDVEEKLSALQHVQTHDPAAYSCMKSAHTSFAVSTVRRNPYVCCNLA